jgi:hypothetical protein
MHALSQLNPNKFTMLIWDSDSLSVYHQKNYLKLKEANEMLNTEILPETTIEIEQSETRMDGIYSLLDNSKDTLIQNAKADFKQKYKDIRIDDTRKHIVDVHKDIIKRARDKISAYTAALDGTLVPLKNWDNAKHVLDSDNIHIEYETVQSSRGKPCVKIINNYVDDCKLNGGKSLIAIEFLKQYDELDQAEKDSIEAELKACKLGSEVDNVLVKRVSDNAGVHVGSNYDKIVIHKKRQIGKFELDKKFQSLR